MNINYVGKMVLARVIAVAAISAQAADGPRAADAKPAVEVTDAGQDCDKWAGKDDAKKAICGSAAALAKTRQGVPDSPALTVLGLKPALVARPKTPEDLAVSFLNAVDADGKQQQGYAVDFLPYPMFAGRRHCDVVVACAQARRCQ